MDVTVVTGASSGMGRSCVDRLRKGSGHLVAVDLKPPDIDGVVAMACDVSDPADVDELVTQVRSLGSFRSLAHAAGISPTMGDARRVFEVDLIGTERILIAFEPLLVAGSSAVCFSSSAAYHIAPYVDAANDVIIDEPLAQDFLDRAVSMVNDDSGFAYALAKRGVVRACARAAVRWGRRGARVNSVAPGIIDTPMGRQELEQQPVMREMLEHTPLGRLGAPDEVAAVVAFLLSPEASFVSGIDVLVDGANVPGMAARGTVDPGHGPAVE